MAAAVPTGESPLVASVESARGRKGLLSARRKFEQASSAVQGIGAALQISAPGHVVHDLAGALLADTKTVGQRARGERLRVQGTEDVAVRSAEVSEAAGTEVLMQLGHELLVGKSKENAEVWFSHRAII